MKQILTTGLVLLALTSATGSYGQGKRVYADDIYGDPRPEKEMRTQPAQDRRESQDYDDQNTYSSSSGDRYDNGERTRQYDDEYSDLDNDYYYASRIRRYYYPFYNQPYFSTFYNPYWYNPYWVDPYWGWSPWTRPGLAVSFGVGPYWSSYWGWSSWYGCGYFGSYYGYPWVSPFGGYYSGYWNGYYAGLYNTGYARSYRTVSYGPRYSLNANTNNQAHNVGVRNYRREMPNYGNQTGRELPYNSNPRTGGMRRMAPDNGRTIQDDSRNSEFVRPSERGRELANPGDMQRDNRNNEFARPSERGSGVQNPREFQSGQEGGMENRIQNQPQRERGGIFSRPERSNAPVRSQQAPREQRNYEAPRYEQRSNPRMESAPSRNFGGGNRGSGGSRMESGGGSYRGGRR